MNEWSVYILSCADGTLYTGITKDIVQRTAKHNLGTASKYTRSRRPVKVIWSEAKHSESTAHKREAQIKKLTRKEKISLIGTRKKPSKKTISNPENAA